VGNIAFDGLHELSGTPAVFVAFVTNFCVPAFDERDLVLCEFEVSAGLFEGFDFFDAAGAKVTDAAHAALVEPHAGFGHFAHAAFDFTFPEDGPILFQPERHLAELAVEHLQAGAGFVLEDSERGGEAAESIGRVDVGGTGHREV
jgi:hypothetical protein